MNKLLAAFVLLLTPMALNAQGVVTSADPRATLAGQEMLRAGGSATDAALAMMVALTVVEPQSSGIGGGGFLVHYDARSGRTATIDGRETAPKSARGDRFVRADGRAMPFLEAVAGGRSVGVPGSLRLAALAHRKWGRLKWAQLFEPAIRLAEGGFTATRALAGASAAASPLWLGQRPIAQAERPVAGDGSVATQDRPALGTGIANYYAPSGKAIVEGQRLTNPALAKTLRAIAKGGPDAFYKGANARALLAQVNGALAPGGMTAADLAGYRAKERSPVCAPYRQWKVCGMGPPSSGATTVFQILGMLERFDLKAMGKDSPAAWNVIGEAMRLAYADREAYLGDPDFVPVPVAGLLDRGYIAGRSALIAPDRALGSYPPGTPPGATARTPGPAKDGGTTHFIAVDRAGDVATYTSTVEGVFGSQLIANGYILNNELTDFTFVPEQNGAPVANRVQPGKRPLSSMAPTIVYDASGKPVFAVGAAGGKTIPMQVTKALIAHLDWGLSARDALGLGLIYYDRDGLILEQGTSTEAFLRPLEKLGQKVRVGRLGLKANAAEKTPAGWVGAADPRSVGTALSE
ncbi:MAG: gamma-glutamyltransferase family protein [Pseudomonadota bacterium]